MARICEPDIMFGHGYPGVVAKFGVVARIGIGEGS
jgi:hypothetical protein